MKKDVFERLARKYYEMHRQSRRLRQLDEDETANRLVERRYGIEEAVVALGFNVDEFIDYYKENRSRYRQEFFEHGTLDY